MEYVTNEKCEERRECIKRKQDELENTVIEMHANFKTLISLMKIIVTAVIGGFTSIGVTLVIMLIQSFGK
jgi:hypothetical protein